MKKNLFFLFIFMIAIFNLTNKYTYKFYINMITSYFQIFNESEDKFAYKNLFGTLAFSEDIFVELPEDKVEEENVPDIIANEEKKVIEDKTNVREVTLEWKTILKNHTKFKIDIDKLLNEKLNFKLNGNKIEALIYHTHTTEAYTKSAGYDYIASGVFRTLDQNVNVVKIGEKMKEYLQKGGVGVYHDKTIYDYPNYNLSYSKAGKNIINIKANYPEAKIVLDLHRDAIGVNTEQYKPVVKINGENVAQFLIVVGTNQGGLSHDGWGENLKLALKIKKKADEVYPGLCRYVILRKERFNQQVAPGAIIVEMGATGNTVDEVIRTSKYFSELLVCVAKD